MFGRVLRQASKDAELSTKRAKEDAYFEAFGTSPADDYVDRTNTFTIYLWPCNEVVYGIYRTLNEYLSKDLEIPTNILLALIEAKNLDLEETLQAIPYIHSGFLSTINKKAK